MLYSRFLPERIEVNDVHTILLPSLYFFREEAADRIPGFLIQYTFFLY